MSDKQIEEVLQLITAFFNENDGNKINRWLALTLLNEVKHLLDMVNEKNSKKVDKKE